MFKKLFTASLTLGLTVGLAACGGTSEETNGSGSSTDTANTAASVGESVE